MAFNVPFLVVAFFFPFSLFFRYSPCTAPHSAGSLCELIVHLSTCTSWEYFIFPEKAVSHFVRPPPQEESPGYLPPFFHRFTFFTAELIQPSRFCPVRLLSLEGKKAKMCIDYLSPSPPFSIGVYSDDTCPPCTFPFLRLSW